MLQPLLKNLGKYVSLTGDETAIVQDLFKVSRFRRHQYLLQEGSVTRYETFILKGLTRTYEMDDKGQEHVVQFGPEDWWVGDYTTTQRLSSTLSKSAAERYEEFILKYPQIEQRVPNHQIASYLGITPQSLSRIRSQTRVR